MKRVNYLRRQSAHRTRVRYKMKLLTEESGQLGVAKEKMRLARSSLEEVNQARKVAGLAPFEEGRGLWREAELKLLAKEGESPREAMEVGDFRQELSNLVEVVVEKIEGGGLRASQSAGSNQGPCVASPSNMDPSLSMMDSDEANNNTVVERKMKVEEVNDLDLGQLDAAAVVAFELINNLVEEIVSGGLCDGGG